VINNYSVFFSVPVLSVKGTANQNFNCNILFLLGNEFSTVEGLVFKWSIEAGRAGVEILRLFSIFLLFYFFKGAPDTGTVSRIWPADNSAHLTK
jgi:hypothetical protein